MNKILVPTDFSDCAEAAEIYAFDLAIKANAELHFIHAVYTPVEWVNLPLDKEVLYPETREVIGQARHKLNTLCSKAEKLGLKSKSAMAYNRGREEILEYVKQHQIDLVVMGSHGAQGIKEILGSNAQMLVRQSEVPVLVIKKSELQPKFNKLVFASTFDLEFVHHYLKLKSIAKLMKAEVYLLWVNTPYEFRETQEAEDIFADFMEAAGERGMPFHMIDALNEERGIVHFAERHDIDIIAVATRGINNLVRLLAPSITESLVNHTSIPVLSVK